MRILFILLFGLLLFNFQTKAQNNALHFDGSNDQVNCGTDTVFDITGKAITIEAWIYAESWGTNIWEGSIVLKEDNISNTGFMLRAAAGGKLNFALGEGGKTWTELTTKSSVLNLYTWYHVAATYDGSKMRLYVDGNLVDSLSSGISIAKLNAQPLSIGHHPSTGGYWHGKIDEVRLWNTVRSRAEINSDMSAEFCSPPSHHLRAYYKFDAGEANGNNSGLTTVRDYSIFNNSASMNGFSLNGTTSNWVPGKFINQSKTYSFDTAHACNQYFYSRTGKLYTSPITLVDSMVSYWGCDSVRSLHLDIQPNTYATINAYECDSFLSPTGIVYKTSGIYYNSLDNSSGCDSIITINLVIGNDSGFIDTAVCYSYQSPAGNTYTQTGLYFESVSGHMGCDSTLVIDLMVYGAGTGITSLNLCDSVLSPSEKYWYRQGGIFLDTLVAFTGCDSVITVTVLDKKLRDTLERSACYSYTSVTGKTYTSTGVYYDTLATKDCYKVYRTELTIHESTSSELDLEGCFAVESPTDGRVFTNSGVYYDTIANAGGCDSFVLMNVTVNKVNVNVFQDDQRLVAQTSNGSVQWLNCMDQFSEVNGATSKLFLAEISSSYAVEVTENNCVDTSACYAVIGSGFSAAEPSDWNLYPNPSDNSLNLESSILNGPVRINIVDQSGRLVYSEEAALSGSWQWSHSLSPGTYMLQCTTDKSTYQMIFVVN